MARLKETAADFAQRESRLTRDHRLRRAEENRKFREETEGLENRAAAETDRLALPLQCVVAETMKATEAAEIAADPTAHTAQKQAISRKLMGIVKRAPPSFAARIARAEAAAAELKQIETKIQG